MEAPAAVLAPHLVFAVQHLVIDDPGHEVVGHAVLIQRGVDADDAIFDREAAHLDRSPPLAARGDRPPGDARLEPAREVRRVQPIEDRLQVVIPARRAQVHLPRTPLLLADDVLVAFDVVAQQRRRPPVVVHDVAGQRPHRARLRAHEHAVQAQPVAVRLTAHRDHAVVVVRQPELERLARRQVERERGRDAVGLLLERGREPDLPRRRRTPERPARLACRPPRTGRDAHARPGPPRGSARDGRGMKAEPLGSRKTAAWAPDAPRRRGEK